MRDEIARVQAIGLPRARRPAANIDARGRSRFAQDDGTSRAGSLVLGLTDKNPRDIGNGVHHGADSSADDRSAGRVLCQLKLPQKLLCGMRFSGIIEEHNQEEHYTMSDIKKLMIPDLQAMKKDGKKISMITAYSFPQAQVVDEAGIEIILVGDSLGMVELGYRDTVPVTMDEMLNHTKAVMRAVKRCHVVGDMPFMSYNISTEQAVTNAGILYKDGGCDSVKLEGGQEMAPAAAAIAKAGIPVFGHIGLTPQTANVLGGFKVQGKSIDAAKKVVDDALAIEAAGAVRSPSSWKPYPDSWRSSSRPS